MKKNGIDSVNNVKRIFLIRIQNIQLTNGKNTGCKKVLP